MLECFEDNPLCTTDDERVIFEDGVKVGDIVQWTTCASFFDAPGYGTQTDGRHFRLESEPGRARSSGDERIRVGPTERLARGMRGLYFRLDAMFQPAEKNSRKSSILLWS